MNARHSITIFEVLDMRPTRIALALTLCILLAACSDDATLVGDNPMSQATVSAAKAPGGGGSSASNANVAITLQVGHDIAAIGDATYFGGSGSVRALVFYYDGSKARSGDLVFDPDMERGTPRRQLSITFGTPMNTVATRPAPGTYSVGPYISVSAAMQRALDPLHVGLTDGWILEGMQASSPNPVSGPEIMRPNEGLQNVTFQYVGLPGCDRLRFENVKVTRTAGSFDPAGYKGNGKWIRTVQGSWTIETTPPHRAVCVYASGRSLVDGAVYQDDGSNSGGISFALTASEL